MLKSQCSSRREHTSIPKSRNFPISNPLVFQDIAYKIMVLRERWKIIVPATMYPNQCYFMGVYFLQLLAVLNRNQPVFGTMDNVGMAIHMLQPFICSQPVHQQKLNG